VRHRLTAPPRFPLLWALGVLGLLLIVLPGWVAVVLVVVLAVVLVAAVVAGVRGGYRRVRRGR
jgi:uncharacterized protein (DUF58 family)